MLRLLHKFIQHWLSECTTATSAYGFAARAYATDIFVVRAYGTASAQSLFYFGCHIRSASTAYLVIWLFEYLTTKLPNTTVQDTALFRCTQELRYQRASGNVGIGTSAPTQKLTVNGSAAVGGNKHFGFGMHDGFSANAARRAWAITANYLFWNI
jgi:hypothetical protein